MHEIETSLTRLRSAWTAGRSALEFCPPEWRGAVDGANGELALIALAGHAMEALTRQAAATPLILRPLLTRLPAPLLPEPLRPRFRRLLATPKNTPSLERPLIDFIAVRGFVAHPGDWMPGPTDDSAPEIYAPWLDWVRAEERTSVDSQIAAENYDQWSWAERVKALKALRAEDPAAARAVIAAKAGAEPAERRVKLIELFAFRLGEADAEFLESLLKDRSERVQALARVFLARLGRATEAEELARELAEMVEVEKIGLLRRRTRLSVKLLKTAPQNARRRELFRLVSLAGLARALGVAELDLVKAAPDGALDGIESFVGMVAASGSDESRLALMDAILKDDDAAIAIARPLAERLTQEERRAILPLALKRDTDPFDTTLALAGPVLGAAPLAAILESPGYATVKANIDAVTAGETTAQTAATRALAISLPRIGLLIDADGARQLLAQLGAMPLSPADPTLDMLHLNAALTSETTP